MRLRPEFKSFNLGGNPWKGRQPGTDLQLLTFILRAIVLLLESDLRALDVNSAPCEQLLLRLLARRRSR
jgi:hypothetical protein